MNLKKLNILWVFLFFISCMTIAPKPSSDLTARQLFLKGQSLLQNDDLVQAEIQFHKALSIKEDYIPALDGLAQIALIRGQFHQAEKWLAKIPNQDQSWPLIFLTRARLKFYLGEFEKSLNQLEHAETEFKQWHLDSLLTEIQILKLRNLMRLNRWTEVRTLLHQLHLNGNLNDQQIVHWAESVEKISTQIPASFRYLIFKKVITRAEFALLISRLFPQLNELPPPFWQFDPNISPKGLKDLPLEKKQARAIILLLEKHILWAFPDQRFYPKDYVNYGELIIVLHRLALAVNTNWLAERQPSFSAPLQQALKFVKEKGIIKAAQSFEPEKKVSGVFTINALLKVKSLGYSLK